MDLALAHACALGYEAAWQQFMTRYQEPLTQAAIGITGSATMGHDLADSLYSAMFGLTERDGERQSPLAYYSGRGSFKGFLRATLARRHVDYHRRTSRETPLPSGDPVAAPSAPAPSPGVLSQLAESLTATLGSLNPEERFLLAAWFLDQRTLLETTANMVMVDLGIPPGFELLTEDLDLYRERSAGKKSGRLEKFSLTPTQAILYFDSIGPNDGLSCRCDCGRSIRSGRVPSRRECMSITIRRLVRWRGRCNWKSARSDARAGEIERIKKRCNIHRVNPLARNWVRFAKFLFGV